MASTTEAVQVPFFKKKRARPTTTRQRSPSPHVTDPVPSASSSKSQVVLPSRKATGNLLSAGTKRTSSQRHADDGGGLDEDEDGESTRGGPGINWTSTGGHVNKALEILAGDEAEEMLAKRVRRDEVDEGDVPDDGLYHGHKSYKSLIKKSQEVPKSMRTGPVRNNNSTIRTVTIVDYQPDVCKDYKGTLAFFFYGKRILSVDQKPVFAALEIRVNSCTIEEHVCLGMLIFYS
jgi:RING finger protein 113A